MSGVAIKPSDVDLSFPHFVGCCSHAEAEFALGLYVRACQVHGDRWQPIQPEQCGEVLKRDREAGREPFAKLTQNPFWFPDFHDLVGRGFARWLGENEGAPVELTDAGFAAVDKWVGKMGEAGRARAAAAAKVPT